MPAATFAQVTDLSFLPGLDIVAGIPTGASADFTQPFISQLKINGGGPVPGLGAQNAKPSFSSLAMKPSQVRADPTVLAEMPPAPCRLPLHAWTAQEAGRWRA